MSYEVGLTIGTVILFVAINFVRLVFFAGGIWVVWKPLMSTLFPKAYEEGYIVEDLSRNQAIAISIVIVLVSWAT